MRNESDPQKNQIQLKTFNTLSLWIFFLKIFFLTCCLTFLFLLNVKLDSNLNT